MAVLLRSVVGCTAVATRQPIQSASSLYGGSSSLFGKLCCCEQG
jgi:hypothetical protein